MLTNNINGPTSQAFFDKNGVDVVDNNNFTKQQYSLMLAISERDRPL